MAAANIKIISIVIVAVALITAGTFLIVQNNDYNHRKEVDSARQAKIDSCLATAETRYHEYWNDTVETFGDKDNKANNTLPEYRSEAVNKFRSDEKTECLKLYAD